MAHRISVIAGSFHKIESEQMIEVVETYCAANSLEIVEVVRVPGSMEKPLALKQQFLKSDVDGAVLLGIIEKGETLHGATMGNAVIKSIIELELEFMKPAGVGILGPGIEPQQIEPRVKAYALAAIVALHKQLAAS